MKVNSSIQKCTTYNAPQPQTIKGSTLINTSKAHKPSFGMSIETGFQMSKKLKTSLFIQKALAVIMGNPTNIKYYDLRFLEGLQEGIDVFKGLKLKQIAFLGEDLHSIMNLRGCYSHCAYCYPGAQKPVKQSDKLINSVLFEDYESLLNGFKKLKERSGLNFIHHHSETPYHTIVYDSDNISVAVKDLKGKIHEFPELNKLLYEATGVKGVFDTSGWSVFSKTHQERAERIVEYYSKPENMNELHQFNISINPFHSTLVKVNELKKEGKKELAEKMYNTHVGRMANALFTCIPLAKSPNFSTIKRALSIDVPNMQGYYFTDEMNLLSDIFKKFSQMAKNDFITKQKYIKNEDKLYETLAIFGGKLERHGEIVNLKNIDIDTTLIGSQNLEEFIRSRNPGMTDFEYIRLFKDALNTQDRFNMIKNYKRYDSAHMFYLKMVDVNGRVYISDNYRMIPTDIQLNYKNKDMLTQEFKTVEKDFVLTKDMI